MGYRCVGLRARRAFGLYRLCRLVISADPCWGGASEIPKGWFLLVFPSRRSNRLQKLATPPPHHPHRFQRFAYTAPFTVPNPLRLHRRQRFAHPLYVVATLPSLPPRLLCLGRPCTVLTAPTPPPHRPHHPGRPCKCFRSI